MRRRKRLSSAIIAIGVPFAWEMILAGCGGEGPNPPVDMSTSANSAPPAVLSAQKADTPVDPAIVDADNAFGLELLGTSLAATGDTNIAISAVERRLGVADSTKRCCGANATSDGADTRSPRPE